MLEPALQPMLKRAFNTQASSVRPTSGRAAHPVKRSRPLLSGVDDDAAFGGEHAVKDVEQARKGERVGRARAGAQPLAPVERFVHSLQENDAPRPHLRRRFPRSAPAWCGCAAHSCAREG